VNVPGQYPGPLILSFGSLANRCLWAKVAADLAPGGGFRVAMRHTAARSSATFQFGRFTVKQTSN
jgi:hypothetical protein